jgi:hypothetical protein
MHELLQQLAMEFSVVDGRGGFTPPGRRSLRRRVEPEEKLLSTPWIQTWGELPILQCALP